LIQILKDKEKSYIKGFLKHCAKIILVVHENIQSRGWSTDINIFLKNNAFE